MEPPFAPGAEPDPPDTHPQVCLLSCSPHAGGSTDAIAGLLEQALSPCASLDAVTLREHAIRPCTGCGHCTTHPGHCVLDGDDVPGLFRRLHRADTLILCLPVYFYGPPALLKGFIDRAQRFWAMPSPSATSRRPAFAAICAARTRGERLFEANLLILRCFLGALGFELRDPLLLRGVETPADITPQTLAQLQELASKAANPSANTHDQ